MKVLLTFERVHCRIIRLERSRWLKLHLMSLRLSGCKGFNRRWSQTRARRSFLHHPKRIVAACFKSGQLVGAAESLFVP